MEIYDWGLVSPRMNIEAFSSLLVDKQSRFEHIERIGSLRYLSAYAVVKNKHNKPLAYLNVPYFTKQSAITQRVSSLVVAFINIYVLLIVIATLFGVFISNKVTKPLLILKEKIREMKLGNKNEKIVWESNDEIGGLINDYNRMVNELESSAQKLAASERDLAWREMAKQIAHEIKNPLTPMKLNIQLLNRAWDTNDEHFHDRLKRVSQTLVEQIDVLATTASEFSNFAHSPEIHNEDINISSIINQCLHLFSHYQGIEFSYINNLATSTTIVGDKEKINRIIINILKNAVQSIPAGTLGRVVITSWEEQCWLCISVSDNGTGIQDDIKQKLFEPYFTTKTSGSGLGLAICKTLVTGMRGEIHFESTHGLGTTFTVKFTKE
jgi:nitrogen fixation/metabolism regulation signal transduction histidine kinase